MRESPRSLISILLGLGLLALAFGFVAYRTSSLFSRGTELPVIGQLPPFTLVERSGAQVGLSQLEGRVWVADFIFTRCAGPCPILSSKMARLQTELADTPDVRLVSFSVDPVADTPDALRTYAEKFKADPERWLFLTGDVATLYSLVEKGFKLPVGDMPPPDKVVAGDLITHTTRFVLVDRHARIRGYFDTEEPGYHEKLMTAIEALRWES